MKVIYWPNEEEGRDRALAFYCPACECNHEVRLYGEHDDQGWWWNGDFERPTITPSLNFYRIGCHISITNGKIQYDAGPWAGKTVDMEDVEI